MIFTGLEVIYFLASNLLVPYNLAKTAYRELAQVIYSICVLIVHALSVFGRISGMLVLRDFLVCNINVILSLAH